MRYLLMGVAVAMLTTPSLHAAILVNYSFTGGSAAPTTQDADVTGGNAAWTGIGISGFSNTTHSAFARADGANVPANFASGKYLSFTVTADPGLFLNLDSLSFDLGGQNTSATLTYTVNTNVRTNLDTYGADLTINPGAVTTATHTVPIGSNTTFANFSADLSGAAFDNLTTITFRLYPFDDSSNSGNYLRYDNITLNGTVAVPEPGNLGLLLFGCVGLLFLRRVQSARYNLLSC